MASYTAVQVRMQNGRQYRVTFDVGAGKAVRVERLPAATKLGASRAPRSGPVRLNLDGPQALAVIEVATPRFKAMIGATGGKR